MRYGTLWVDDEKPAPRHLAVEPFKNYPAALERLLEGDVHTLYLDYVLGPVGYPTGVDLLNELVERNGQLPEVITGISANAECNNMIRDAVDRLRKAGAKQHPGAALPSTDPCKGCHDDFYNRGNKKCWSLETAKLVKRWRIGTWTEPTVGGAFTEVEVYHCRSEQGAHFQDKLPAFAVNPRRLPVL